jgi:hypothetical protein
MEIKPYIDSYKDQGIQLYLDIQNKEFAIPIAINERPDLLQIPEVYQTGNSNFWVALDNECVVGTVALLDIANQQCVLKYMYVNKEVSWKGKRCGKCITRSNNDLVYAKAASRDLFVYQCGFLSCSSLL